MAIEKNSEIVVPMDGVEVDVEAENEEALPSNIEIIEDEDGGVTLAFGEETASDLATEHDANLAEVLDEGYLGIVSDELLQLVQGDKESRQDWEKMLVDGMDLLGFKLEERTKPFKGASNATHPLLSEAIVQFQSTAFKQLMPADGPVKSKILGKVTPQREAQAKRVSEYMNYVITEDMPEYTPDFDQMLFYLGYGGSTFKKVYYDGINRKPAAPFILPDNLIIPYNGTSNMEECERITNVIPMSTNTLRKMQVSGIYRDVATISIPITPGQIQSKVDEIEGVEPAGFDEEVMLYEIHVDLDIPGFEDLDADGEPTGIKLPYIVTIDESNGKVLAIRRNWNEDDEYKRKKEYFVHYQFIRGPGAYGLGLVHLIGGLSKAATGMLRQLMDAGTLANLPAGFKTRGLRIADHDKPLQPGEFRDVDTGGIDIKQSLLPLPYKEPSQTLFVLLGACVQFGQRFAQIADLQVGDGNQQAAVGTTMALLERGSTIMSAIHKRLHYAQKQEFKLLARVVKENMPDSYPYAVEGADRTVKAEDFDDRVDVIPVSDPNIVSTTQRITMAQTQLQLAQSAPQMHNMHEAYRRMYEALGVKNIDDILLPDDSLNPKPKDPATENMDVMDNKVLKAFAGQNHDAHIVSHLIQGMSPVLQANPLAAVALQKHVLQHVKLKAEEKVEAEIFQEYGPEGAGMVSDIEKEARIATYVVQFLQEVRDLSNKMSGSGAPDPLVQLKEQELKLREVDNQRKAMESQAKIQQGQQEIMQDAQIAQARIQSQEDIAQLRAQTNIMKMNQQAQQAGARNALDARKQQQNNQ